VAERFKVGGDSLNLARFTFSENAANIGGMLTAAPVSSSVAPVLMATHS
jgi:hypothetical protein